MRGLTIADALRLAINVLRDAAESRRVPSGIGLDESTVQLHFDAAETLEQSFSDLMSHEEEKAHVLFVRLDGRFCRVESAREP